MCLEDYEKAWGPDDTSPLDRVDGLSNPYNDEEKMAEDEKMHQRALEDKEKALGPDHTSTLDAIHSLGNLYAKLGVDFE